MKWAKIKRNNKLLFVNTFRKFTQKKNKTKQNTTKKKRITHLITFIETHQWTGEPKSRIPHLAVGTFNRNVYRKVVFLFSVNGRTEIHIPAGVVIVLIAMKSMNSFTTIFYLLYIDEATSYWLSLLYYEILHRFNSLKTIKAKGEMQLIWLMCHNLFSKRIFKKPTLGFWLNFKCV